MPLKRRSGITWSMLDRLFWTGLIFMFCSTLSAQETYWKDQRIMQLEVITPQLIESVQQMHEKIRSVAISSVSFGDNLPDNFRRVATARIHQSLTQLSKLKVSVCETCSQIRTVIAGSYLKIARGIADDDFRIKTAKPWINYVNKNTWGNFQNQVHSLIFVGYDLFGFGGNQADVSISGGLGMIFAAALNSPMYVKGGLNLTVAEQLTLGFNYLNMLSSNDDTFKMPNMTNITLGWKFWQAIWIVSKISWFFFHRVFLFWVYIPVHPRVIRNLRLMKEFNPLSRSRKRSSIASAPRAGKTR